jgi:signal transduction histidine kinase/signal recognition particle subunit SEC65
MSDQSVIVQLAVAAALLLAGAVAASTWAVRRAEQRLSRMMQSASMIVSSALEAPDSYRAMDGMAERLAELFDAEACVVALPTGDGRLFCGPTFGYPDPENLFIPDDAGVCGAVYTSGQPLVVTDVRDEPRFIERAQGIRSTIAVPLRHQGEILGAWELESRKRGRYSDRDLTILTPLADQIAAVMANVGLRFEAEQRAIQERKIRNELQAIASVVMAGVASSRDLDAALHSMLEEISAKMGWESMAVILFADDGLLYTRAYYGYPLHSTVNAFRPGEGIVGTVASTGVGRLAPDVTKDPDYIGIVNDTRAEMCMPMFAGEKVIGVLNAESVRPGAFDDDDFRMLGTLARQMAIVIERTRIADIERLALERLREADELKDDFVATVSHELRTPLTSIKGYAQTMLVRAADLGEADRATFLEVILRQCNRLAAIVDTLLLASRLESGELGGTRSYVSLGDVLRDAAEASNGGERITIEVASGVGMITDTFRLHHIVRNLMENACKYSPADSTVLVRAAPTAGGEVLIEILDDGPGIPDGERERIFERFHRVIDPDRSAVPGTGLGLYITRRFASDLGGTIEVDRANEAGMDGAHFKVRVPSAFEEEPQTQSVGSDH